MLALTDSLKSAVNARGGVLYIDTESSFSPMRSSLLTRSEGRDLVACRVLEIAATRFPAIYGSAEAQQELANRIQVYTIKNSVELAGKLESLDEEIVERNVRMIVLDSIASIARVDFDSNATSQRQNLLARIASVLKQLAETFRIPVVVVNQITTATGKTPVVGQHIANVETGTEVFLSPLVPPP